MNTTIWLTPIEIIIEKFELSRYELAAENFYPDLFNQSSVSFDITDLQIKINDGNRIYDFDMLGNTTNDEYTITFNRGEGVLKEGRTVWLRNYVNLKFQNEDMGNWY